MSSAAPLMALLLLAGCTYPDFKLIDQRSFASAPPPVAADIARARLPPLPLLVIRFDNIAPDYGPALADAVAAATSRKANVKFDVLTPIPLEASAAIQARATAQGRIDASTVANALAADGVAADAITMGFHGDDGTPPREVQIYAR